MQPEAHQHGQITVFGRDRRDDDPAADGKDQKLDDKKWQQRQCRRDPNLRFANKDINQKQPNQQNELDHEGDQVRKSRRDRCNQARIVHLPHSGPIFEKRVARRLHSRGKQAPTDVARHIKQESRQQDLPRCVCRGKFSQLSENHCEDQCGQQWLNDSPKGTEHRLLVHRGEIPFN